MKAKRIVSLALSLLMAVSCVVLPASAAAAAPTASGVYDVHADGAYTVEPQTAKGAKITSVTANIDNADKTFYPEAERFKVEKAGADSNKFYLVAMVPGTENTITDALVYIDQKDNPTSTVTFDVFPKAMAKGTYTIWVSASGDGAMTKAATFQYYQNGKLGDINSDESIDSTDAMLALQHFVELITLTDDQQFLANVNKDDSIDSTDAMLILQFFVELIPSFD